jgi:hypothetical protein
MKKRFVGLAAAAAATAATAGLGVAAIPASAAGCGYASGYLVSVNAHTSCAFGYNVASAVRRGYRYPVVYSPVTGLDYRMSCYRAGATFVVCRGGNNAAVGLAF